MRWFPLWLVVALSGCRAANADGWASDAYGEAAAATFRAEVSALYAAAVLAPDSAMTQEKTGTLRRPYLAFFLPAQLGESVAPPVQFHVVDKRLAPPPVLADVRSVAVVNLVHNFRQTGWLRMRDHSVEQTGVYDELMLVALIDRETKQAQQLAIEGHDADDLWAALEATDGSLRVKE